MKPWETPLIRNASLAYKTWCLSWWVEVVYVVLIFYWPTCKLVLVLSKLWRYFQFNDEFYFLCLAIQFEHDTILIPKETSWFGYYPDGAFDPVLPVQEVIFLLKLFLPVDYLHCELLSFGANLNNKFCSKEAITHLVCFII